ncbi:MCE family protein [Ginsengibacter hankyongi]|uniref:MCE family protein n=1 Tax=Ginsengibacter hankyongi TaxID=2607284 RepID=A0A5J5IPD8_9BACT|nr:MlaD family protein [Ginsengibacter hankyongi]KAA9041834.1 MCE family protein [Ginsengibacter hankyongi]
MKSTGYTRTIIVGIFVFLGVAIFIITVLTLGSQRKTFEKSITVKTVFDNVNGLQKGNNVWFSGVKVGTIKRVNLKDSGKVEVVINIEDVSVKFIPKDAKAKLSSDGLIGNKIIEIHGGTPDGAKIQEGDIIGSDKILSTDAMMSTLSKNNDNILAITNDFKLISSRIVAGKGSIGKLLTDETLADQLNATTNILKRASLNLERLSENVSDYTAKLNNKGSLANDLVTDTVIFNKLRTTVSRLQNIADSSQNIIANFNKTGNIINEGLTNKNTPAGMLLSDEQSANKIKGTLQNLQSASKKLDEDLEALQHNFLLRGFFKKKAKQDKENSKIVLDTVVTN